MFFLRERKAVENCCLSIRFTKPFYLLVRFYYTEEEKEKMSESAGAFRRFSGEKEEQLSFFRNPLTDGFLLLYS